MGTCNDNKMGNGNNDNGMMVMATIITSTMTIMETMKPIIIISLIILLSRLVLLPLILLYM